MMKTIKYAAIATFLLTASTNALAVLNGPFFGLQLGESTTNYKTETVITSPTTTENVSPSSGGLAGRLFLGYNFNEYAAWELGYTYYASSSYKPSDSSGGTPGIRRKGIDVVAKGIYPFSTTGFDVFAKAGFTVIHDSISATIITSGNPKGGGNNTGIKPIAGIGVSYDITQRWVADLSWNHVFGGGDIPSSDFLALGISWHWTDLYCGQFLC